MDNSDSTDREQMGAGDKNNNGEGLGLDSLLEGDEDEDEDEIEAPLTKNRSEGKSPDHAYAHADAHAQGSRPAAEGAVSEDTVKVAAVDSRIPFEKLYASIYLSQSSAMAVPEDILQRQLSACMKLHGYTPEEIAHHLLQTRQHAPEFEGKLKRGPVAETNISYNSINEKQQHTQASSPPQRENGLLGAREKLERQAAIRKSRSATLPLPLPFPLFYPILSYPILSYPILSYPIIPFITDKRRPERMYVSSKEKIKGKGIGMMLGDRERRWKACLRETVNGRRRRKGKWSG